MKKALGLVVVGILCTGAAVAEDSTGCGAGTLLFDGQSGLAPQVLAVTTNGTVGNQTFGISSGTLGCDTEGMIVASARLNRFTSRNFETLAQNMAVGEGETLTTLANMIGIADKDKPAFFAATKTHFDTIFASHALTARDMLVGLEAVMADDAVLAHYVS
ncbi:MAG: DUF3015 domain-containing protein [Gammaproteobacteria bacterium]|nr:DUF3015 domain-containing protein [Gammaproteobacteria bacterium]MBA3731433.1 DUF3015 domain-containing protein [Gammaproteobacteria bacterium]